MKGGLAEGDIYILRELLDVIEELDAKVRSVEARIAELAKAHGKEIEILMSVPGVCFTAAATILGEVGDISRFPSPKHLISYVRGQDLDW